MHHRAKDLSGQKLGYLTVSSFQGSDGKKSLWELVCVCGARKLMPATEITKQQKRGIVASCGCKRRETIGTRLRTHGMSRHKAFAVWRSMLDRCRLPSHQAWRNYGGRGITVCERWQRSFSTFWADMGSTYQDGLTLERVDNMSGYSPENCRWASRKRQARNKRSNSLVDTPWGSITVAEAAERSGIGRSTLYYRVGIGLTGPELFAAPDTSRKFTIL